MIIRPFDSFNETSRLSTFVCFLILFLFIQSQLVVAIDTVPDIITNAHFSWNKTFLLENASNFTDFNLSSSESCIAEPSDDTLSSYALAYRIFAGALIVPITFCAISGNILVIYVIKHYHALRITGNVFLASLAVADVGVSTLAMTFYGLQLLLGRWILGAFMCRLWFSCDVLFSTASIMHLACIALDRYLSIVHPFEHERTFAERRRYGMMFGCWFGSALLSFIPIFTGIYTSREQRDKIDCLNRVRGRCIFAVNQAYAIVSSLFSFWVPSAIMIVMYVMLIRIADEKEREVYRLQDGLVQRHRLSQPAQYHVQRPSSDEQTPIETSDNAPHSQRRNQRHSSTPGNGYHNNHHRRSTKQDSIDAQIERQVSFDGPGGLLDPRNSHMKHLKRERRAVKTLGAIMLAFLICWLPFFIRYSACEPDRCRWPFMRIVEDLVFWVGYFNSMINPFLYAFHNKDFRLAFQKTLSKYFGCCRQRRTSTSSSIPIPPPTPSGEITRTGSKKQKKKFKNQKVKPPARSISDERQRDSDVNGIPEHKTTEPVDRLMNNGENSTYPS